MGFTNWVADIASLTESITSRAFTNWRADIKAIADYYGVSTKGNWRGDLKAIREYIESGKAGAFVADTSKLSGIALAEGSFIATQGFYSSDDGGAAVYILQATGTVDNITVFATGNGLFAHLRVYAEMSVLQFGAKPDVKEDNFPYLQAAANSVASIIHFPEDKEFHLINQLWLKGNKTYLGHGSTITTGNDFIVSHWDTQGVIMYIFREDNIVIDALNMVDTRNVSDDVTLTHFQIILRQSDNITIKNSTFKGPDAVYNEDGTSVIRHFNNIDIYDECSNVTIENNKMYVTHDGAVGLCLQIRDVYGKGARHIYVRGNYMEKVCHDEIIALGSNGAILSDIYINNNVCIMKDGQNTSSVIGLSIGGGLGIASLENIFFENNTLDIQATNACLSIGLSGAINYSFSGNDITCRRGKGYDSSPATGGTGIVRNSADDTSIPCIFEGNKITFENSGDLKIQYLLGGALLISRNNTLNIVGDAIYTIYGTRVMAENDNIKCSGNIARISDNGDKVFRCTINALSIGRYFAFYNKTFTQLDFSENLITAESAPNASQLIASNSGSATEESLITINNNVIKAPSNSSNYLYIFFDDIPTLNLLFQGNVGNGSPITNLFPNVRGDVQAHIID